MQTEAQQNIWQKLAHFDFDGNAQWSFTKRLAQENGWSLDYSKRVVDEYRKFLYLARFAGHVVTPSDEVDQAWHLHMVYTQSYWIDLCEHTLGQPLHHGPTQGGNQESTKFRDLYEDTLTSYRSYFGPEPKDIWPPKSIRFHRATQFQRVNIAENWVVPKSVVKQRIQLSGSAALVVLMLAGCSFGLAQSPFLDSSIVPIVLIGAIFLGIVALAIHLLRQAFGGHQQDREKREDDSDQSPMHYHGSGCGTSSSGADDRIDAETGHDSGFDSSGHANDAGSSSGADSGGSGGDGGSSGCGGGGCSS